MFAVITNPEFLVPGILHGAVLSRHRSADAARRAFDAKQRRHRKDNPGNSYLNLGIIEVEAFTPYGARGRPA